MAVLSWWSDTLMRSLRNVDCRCASSLLLRRLCLLSRKRLRCLLIDLLRRHHGGVKPMSCLGVVLLRFAVELSAATHTTCEVVVIVIVIASTEEFLGPALEGFLERSHEGVGLRSGLMGLRSSHGDRGAARGGRRWCRHCWNVR